MKCEDPGIPNYGYKIRDEGHFVDTVIVYSCNPGYTMHGSSTMTCLSGDRRVWDKPLPTCIGNVEGNTERFQSDALRKIKHENSIFSIFYYKIIVLTFLKFK